MSTLRKVSDAGKSTIRPQSKLSTTAFRKHFEKALDKVRFEGRRIVLAKFDGCCAAVPMTTERGLSRPVESFELLCVRCRVDRRRRA